MERREAARLIVIVDMIQVTYEVTALLQNMATLDFREIQFCFSGSAYA